MNKINNLQEPQHSSLRIIINAYIRSVKSICCGWADKKPMSYNVYCGYKFYKHNSLWLTDAECNKPLTALYRTESKSDKLLGGATFVVFVALVILVGMSL